MNKTYHLTLPAKLLSAFGNLCTILFTYFLFFGVGIIRDPIGWLNQIRFVDGWSALWFLFPCILLLFSYRMIFLAARQSVSIGAVALTVNQPNDLRAPRSKKILYQTVEYQNIIRVIYYRHVGSLFIFTRTHPVKVVSIGWS